MPTSNKANKPRLRRAIAQSRPSPRRSYSLIPDDDGEIIDLSFIRDNNKVYQVNGKNVIFNLPHPWDYDAVQAQGITPLSSFPTTGDGYEAHDTYAFSGKEYTSKSGERQFGVHGGKQRLGYDGWKFTIVNDYITGGMTGVGICIQNRECASRNGGYLIGGTADHDTGYQKGSTLSEQEVCLKYGGALTAAYTTYADKLVFEYCESREVSNYWRWSAEVWNGRSISIIGSRQVLP
tara:strand:- start:9622 stop:10326 length:705 start_codon:yes stop_codon:yes gene_type:complete